MIAAFSVVVLFFSQLNNSQVAIDFYFIKSREFSLWFVIIASFLSGWFVTVLFFFIDFLKVKLNERSYKSQIKKLTKELNLLRNQPIEDVDSIDDEPDSVDSSSESK